MTMRQRSVVIAVSLVLALAAGGFAQALDDQLIVPGERIGAIKLGANASEVVSVLGKPSDERQRDDGTVNYFWTQPPAPGYEGVGMRVTREGEVVLAWVSYDPKYATRDGLKVGSTEVQIVARLGTPTKVEGIVNLQKTLTYDGLGIEFVFDLTSIGIGSPTLNKVVRISVYRKR